MPLQRTSNISPTEQTAKFKSVTPSLMRWWRSFWNQICPTTLSTNSNSISKLNDQESITSAAMEDVYLDSFEETFPDELSVKVCKESIRQRLTENIKKLGTNVNNLQDIENGKIQADHVQLRFQNCSFEDKDRAFLWAAFVKRDDLLEPLYRIGADLNSTLPHEGFSALHLAALSGCVKSCKWLILNGLELNDVVNNLSPLHCAVLGNSLDCTKVLLKHGVILGSTVLHCCVQVNAIDCMKLLLAEKADVNAVDSYGLTAIHVAAYRGMDKCLQIILACDQKVDLTIQSRERRSTALHLASDYGSFECVRLLINAGADVNLLNHKNRTALHLAVRAQSVECVELLLNAGCDVNSLDIDCRSPLHAAVSNTVFGHSALEILLKRGGDVNLSDRYGYTPLHIAALNELSQCVDCLIMSGADVTACSNGGLSALSIISRKTPGSINTICQKLDQSISMNDYETSNKEIELTLDFRYLLQNSSESEVGFLKTVETEGQKHLIEHPLCEAFLHLKWQKIRKFYFCRLFLCLMFVILFTVYVISALAHGCYNAAHNVTSPTADLCKKKSVIGNYLIANPGFIENIWQFLVVMTVFEIVRKIIGIPGHKSIKDYFFQLMNLNEWFVISSVFLVSYVWNKQTFEWQNHVGALAVLLAWTNFMVMIGQLPVFGTYVAMFTKVQVEFFKLLFAYSCLLIGFTACFCAVFPSSKNFHNPLIGFIKVLVMMTGEVDLEILTSIVEESFLLNISAHIIFVLFLLFVTIVLMNLLVGIAVHDIQGLHKTAGLSKLVRQTELIYFLELAIRRGYVPEMIMKIIRQLALVSPPTKRGLRLNPLNPQENRLPKEVLMAVFNLAKHKKSWNNPASCWKSSLCGLDTISYRDENHLSDEVKKLKEMIQIQNSLISKLINSGCSNLSKKTGHISF